MRAARIARAGSTMHRCLSSSGAHVGQGLAGAGVRVAMPAPYTVPASTRLPSHRSMRAYSTDPSSSTAAVATDSAAPSWEVKMLYDGDCPLCMKEVEMLMRRDEGVGKIKFVDISADDYSAEDNAGIDFDTAMERIHAIRADGSVITNVEVFRELYEKVGLGWVYWITTIEPIGKLADSVYDFWAKYRLPITGRPSLEIVLENRRRDGKTCADMDTACEVPKKD